MKAIVDKEKCIGCTLCAGLCPEVFDMDHEGKAYVLVESVPPEAEDSCRKAADECPVEAISIAS